MNTRVILLIVLYIIPLSGAGTDLYAPSLPAIAQALGVTASTAKLTMTAYLIGFSLGQFLFGTLSDLYGRKRVLMCGLLAFTLASFFGAITSNIGVLIAMRLIQGLGAAAPSTNAKSLLVDTMHGKQLQNATAYMVIAWGLGPILAPVIGGYIQVYFDWHANFYFLTAYSFSMLLLVAVLLRETLQQRVCPKLSIVFCNYGRVLKDTNFMLTAVALGIGYGLFVTFGIVGPFLIQEQLGFSAIVFGHMALLIGLAFFAGSITNRFLLSFLSGKQILTINLALIALLGFGMLITAYALPMSLSTIVAPIMLLMFTTAHVNPNLLSHSLTRFPDISGIASATLGGVFIFCAAVITFIASMLHHSYNLAPTAWLYFVLSILYAAIYFGHLRARLHE